MGLFNFLSGLTASNSASTERQQDILNAIQTNSVPQLISTRLQASREGARPWLATFSPAELLIMRSHGMRPIAAVSSTCWLQYGWSWTKGHAQGWQTAVDRLREEAKAAGANAVLDVKMRTIPLNMENSMDFTLIGTAVYVEGLPPSPKPIVATVPALEFAKLLESDIIPVGIAVGAEYQWLSDWNGRTNLLFMGNIECRDLSNLWENVRRGAQESLRMNARPQGNGVLAHVSFSQMFEQEGDQNRPKQYLARHIVIATVVDTSKHQAITHPIQMVVDMHDGKTPLQDKKPFHESYTSNESDGGI
ncbi:heavy metal-binding domain-containing protein [Legionella sp. km772]|uniref:heavy metal-binding domain-containing protein n=1 Tax=Legionella sp. km772 TaxID=2498111 RepID=UPI000F8F43E7|nr:heavy metal-binding domain-containing protein [Legionella sp. km772]RUR08772.1 heavy metal-binding domain-containing protein [Legionella sp. km772]